MQFGKSKEEINEQIPSGGGDFMRYLKDGDTTFRILQEVPEWKYFAEHFNPNGYSFPCNMQEDCPGCTSDNEKMSKRQKRAAFNVLQSAQGQDYVNVYKVAITVADKLENRYNRLQTITDRDYTITRYKTSGDRYDFDVEGGMSTPVDLSKYELKDVEAMLAQQWEDSWGNGQQAQANRQGLEQPRRGAMVISREQPEDPPFKEQVVREADLRQMSKEDLLLLIKKDMGAAPPESLSTVNEIVDWLIGLQP